MKQNNTLGWTQHDFEMKNENDTIKNGLDGNEEHYGLSLKLLKTRRVGQLAAAVLLSSFI